MSDAGISDILERMTVEDGSAAAPPQSQPKPPEDDAEAAADALRRQVADRTRERDEATRRAQAEAQRRQEAEAEAQRVRQQADASDQAAVTNALSAAKQEEERLQSELASAGEAGDFKRVGEISAKLGRIGARIESLETGAQAFETRRTETLREPPKPTQPVDPIEADLAGRTPRTAAWLRDHREFYTDRKFNAKVVGAHNLAIANDLQPDTDEYFRFVEETIGLTQPAQPASQPTVPARQAATPPAAAAPPTRSAPAMSGRGSAGDITISAEDRRIAEWLGIDAEQYAQDRADMERKGELYRTGKRR